MESDAYQEYFKKPKNKLSLAMWVLINNNIVNQNLYLAFMAADFTFSTLIIICLYNQVGSIPAISISLTQALDFQVQPTLQMINIAIAGVLFMCIATIMALVIAKLPWVIYSSQKVVFQLLSLMITLIKQPLFGVICLFIIDSFFEFKEQLHTQIKSGGSTQVNYAGLACTIISTVALAVISYFGAYLFNLSVPNNRLPWSCISHQPTLLNVLFKALLMLAFKVRAMNLILLYAISLLALIACVARLYVLIYRAHLINDVVFNMTIIFETAHAHMLLFFLVTCLQSGNPEPYYIVCAVGFLPVSCLAGLYLKRRYKRSLLFDSLSNSHEKKSGFKDSGEELLLAYLNLVYQCIEESESSQAELIRLDHVHYTQCSDYYDKSSERIRSNTYHSHPEVRVGLLACIFKFDDLESNADIILTNQDAIELEGHEEVVQAYEGSASQSQVSNMNLDNVKRQFQSGAFKINTSHNIHKPTVKQQSGFQNLPVGQVGSVHQASNVHNNMGQSQLMQDSPLANIWEDSKLEEDKTDEMHYKIIKKRPLEAPQYSMGSIADYSMIDQAKSGQQNQAQGHFQIRFPQTKLEQKVSIDSYNSGKINKSPQKLNHKDSIRNINGVPSRIFNAQRLRNALEKRNYDKDERWVQLRYLVNHLFNFHIPDNVKASFKLKLLRVYYTFHVLNNSYLANFQLFSNQEEDDANDLGFIATNLRLLHHKYFDDLILNRQKQVEDSQQMQHRGSANTGQPLDIRNILYVNQLLVEFDTKLEVICENIHAFWESLLTSNGTRNIFINGIGISEKLSLIMRLLKQIQEQQTNYETKTYIQMAQFYQLVVFKPTEAQSMLEKAKIAMVAKNLQKRREQKTSAEANGISLGGDSQTEKCLIMARISVKKPMKIEFFNKNALKLLQYSPNEVQALTINHLMPRFIAEGHQMFVDEFMMTGKSRMLRTRRELYVKQSSGAVVPVFTYLYINSMSRKHMVFLFEENTSLQLFDQPYNDKPFAFAIVNKNYEYGELSSNFQKVTGVSLAEIKHLERDRDRKLIVCDFVMIRNQDIDVRQAREQYGENAEVEIEFHNVKQNFMLKKTYNSTQGSDNSFRKTQNATQDDKNHMDEEEKPHDYLDQQYFFIMKIMDVKFVGGKFDMHLLAFRRIPRVQNARIDCGNQIEINMVENPKSGQFRTKEDDEDDRFSLKNDEEQSAESTNNYDMSSQASTSNGSNSALGTQTILSAFSSKTNSTSSPKTLKFLINLVLSIVIIMIITSSIVLNLAQDNLTYAYNGINISQHSFQSYDETSLIQMLWRGISNMAHGYVPRSGPFIIDRFRDYRQIIYIERRELRDDTDEMIKTSAQEGTLSSLPTFECGSISEFGEFYTTSETVPTGLSLITTKSATLLAEQMAVNSIGSSKLPMFNLDVSLAIYNRTFNQTNSSQSVSQIEQDIYFIINNTNGIFEQFVIVFAPEYVAVKLSQIANKLSYLNGTALGVIVMIVLSGVIILPLFGRIQNRIMELMKLFFRIDFQQKREILKKIKDFQGTWFQQGQRQFRNQDSISSSANQVEQEKNKIASQKSIEVLKETSNQMKLKPRRFLGDQREEHNDRRGDPDQPLASPSPLLGSQREDPGTKLPKKLSKIFVSSKTRGLKKDKKKSDRKAQYVIEEEDKEEEESGSEQSQVEDEDESRNDQESGEEGQERPKRHRKKKRKQKVLDEIVSQQQKQQEEAFLEVNQAQISEFKKYINNRRIWQSILIIILLCCMSSYYLAMYLLSTEFNLYAEDSIRDLEATFSRYSCHVNIITMYTESFFSGTNLTDAKFEAINNMINQCMEAEHTYKKYLVGSTVPYMQYITPAIDLMESGVLCPMLIEQTATPDNCFVMQAQISQIGMPSYLFGYLQQIQQMVLDLEETIKAGKFSKQFAISQIQTLTNYVDMMIDIVFPNHCNIEDLMIQYTAQYFQDQQPLVTSIFAGYISSMIFLAILSFIFVFQGLKKEMIQSNRMLYIIDFEQLTEEERQSILRFLLKH